MVEAKRPEKDEQDASSSDSLGDLVIPVAEGDRAILQVQDDVLAWKDAMHLENTLVKWFIITRGELPCQL